MQSDKKIIDTYETCEFIAYELGGGGGQGY
jgi:hypothetical protein